MWLSKRSAASGTYVERVLRVILLPLEPDHLRLCLRVHLITAFAVHRFLVRARPVGGDPRLAGGHRLLGACFPVRLLVRYPLVSALVPGHAGRRNVGLEPGNARRVLVRRARMRCWMLDRCWEAVGTTHRGAGAPRRCEVKTSRREGTTAAISCLSCAHSRAFDADGADTP